MNYKLARQMQQQILGPRRFVADCGCVGVVDIYFPKKPWVYVEEWLRPCGSTHRLGAAWYDKETATPVSKERFSDAWTKVTKRCDKYIVVSSQHPDYKYLISENGDIGLDEAHSPHPKKMKPEWPPKMGELFKKRTPKK